MERKLIISDLISQQDAEIIEDPYRFLGLPEDAPLADVRRTYIGLAKIYHPDLVNPSFEVQHLKEVYTPQDFSSLEEEIISNLDSDQDSLFETITQALSIPEREFEAKPGRREEALRAIRSVAHQKMIVLNRAYEEIKSRYSPRERNALVGYDFETYYNWDERYDNQRVYLEGRGEVTIYPNNYEYWVKGAYLSFDYGPVQDHPWYDWLLRHAVVVKHLFVYMEIQEGRRQISRVLLEPFFECFNLGKAQQELFLDLLVKGKSTKDIMEEMEILSESKLPYVSPEEKNKWLYSLKFRRHTNEMRTLSTEPDWSDNPIKLKLDSGKLTLQEYGETVFSEADYILLSTLAYGPMIT